MMLPVENGSLELIKLLSLSRHIEMTPISIIIVVVWIIGKSLPHPQIEPFFEQQLIPVFTIRNPVFFFSVLA